MYYPVSGADLRLFSVQPCFVCVAARRLFSVAAAVKASAMLSLYVLFSAIFGVDAVSFLMAFGLNFFSQPVWYFNVLIYANEFFTYRSVDKACFGYIMRLCPYILPLFHSIYSAMYNSYLFL